MSKVCRKPRERGLRSLGDHEKYISRITKTLYYGKLPKTDRLSLPVTELAAELFSEAQRGHSLDRLHVDYAAEISRNACVSSCSLVLALLYLERLKQVNPEYLKKTAPSDLFLVSMIISCKFLYDDGESDEVFLDEWATSGGLPVQQLVQLERDFLDAINWKVYVNELTFWKKLADLETTLARREGTNRGFFTYTELQNLLTIIEVNNIIQCIVAATVILAASYTAAILTLAGSVFVVSHIPGTCIHRIHPQVEPEKIDNQSLPIIYDFPMQQLDSVLGENLTDCNFTCGGRQDVTWDWWTVPIMTWLAQTSTLFEHLHLPLHFRSGFETSVTNSISLELDDHIRKATTTRIQDLLENSWHKEWTETISYDLREDNICSYYYLNNIKS